MLSSELNAPRPLDHLVLPVPALDVAQARLSALGFTVAPQGDHPFGTINACVFFGDGTFLEPLAIGDPVGVMNAMRAGNAFVAGDAAYRGLHGGNGFSGVVLASEDADIDDAAFHKAGFSGGKRLDFQRPFRTPAGEEAVAAFRLAFAAPGKSAASLFFTCERVNPPKVDRSALQSHANGVTGIARVIACAEDPGMHRAFLETFTATPLETINGGLAANLPNAQIRLLTPQACARETGENLRASLDNGVEARAIVFRVCDMQRIAHQCADVQIAVRRADSAMHISPAPGQGATFIFEA